MAWRDRRNDSTRPALFHDFAKAANDPSLDDEAAPLDAILFTESSEAPGWSGKRLFRRVAKARTKRSDAEAGDDSLPSLKP